VIAQSDLPAIRALIQARRAAGRTRRPYGGGRHQDHVWTAPTTGDPSRPPRNTVRPRKVTWYEGELEYRNAGASKIAATIRPESMADVLGWLRLLGLLAEDSERSASIEARSLINDRVGAIA
jgi:hypothetical protein